MTTPCIGIVGAGPVGLSAALALTRAGIECRVFEKLDGVDRQMRASTFHPPTLDIIDALGIGDELVKAGLPVTAWQVRQHESGAFARFELAAIDDLTMRPYRLQCEQYRFCELAVAVLGDRVCFNAAVESLAQDDESVAITITGQEHRFDYLLGADGAASTIRKALGLDYGGVTYEHASVLVSTDFPFDDYLESLDGVSYCWSERGPFSLLKLKDRWRASLYPGTDDLDAAADEQRIRDWLAYIHPAAREANLSDIQPYRVHERCVDSFRAGRVFLAGDAAHLNPPSGGMGMNGGIHDAMNWVHKLLKHVHGADEAILDQYDRQRRHVVSRAIIPQASANRERMATHDRDEQTRRLKSLREVSDDPLRHRHYVYAASMFRSLREADAID